LLKLWQAKIVGGLNLFKKPKIGIVIVIAGMNRITEYAVLLYVLNRNFPETYGRCYEDANLSFSRFIGGVDMLKDCFDLRKRAACIVKIRTAKSRILKKNKDIPIQATHKRI